MDTRNIPEPFKGHFDDFLSGLLESIMEIFDTYTMNEDGDIECAGNSGGCKGLYTPKPDCTLAEIIEWATQHESKEHG